LLNMADLIGEVPDLSRTPASPGFSQRASRMRGKRGELPDGKTIPSRCGCPKPTSPSSIAQQIAAIAQLTGRDV
jgi:hypothetical protein